MALTRVNLYQMNIRGILPITFSFLFWIDVKVRVSISFWLHSQNIPTVVEYFEPERVKIFLR
jgi:hypothetical protein